MSRQRARKCIAGGDEASPDRMLRFVLDPDGFLMADLGGKLPGRGAWTSSTREAVSAALAKGLFGRALKKAAPLRDGTTAVDFIAGLEAGLEARALAALGLARRSGVLALGFDQVRAALKDRKVTVLVTAADAGEDGAEKLARLAGDAPVVRGFSVAAQSAALGRDGVTHAALLHGGSERFRREAQRLSGFRPVFADRLERQK